MNKFNFLLRCTALVLFCGALLQATEPLKWTVSTQREFLEGDLKGVSVTSDGKLILAPALDSVLDTEESFIYSAVADRTGNLYLGTGSEGKIYRLTPQSESKEWAKLDETGVHALAVDSMNRTYAGTSPDGKVYRLDDQGQAESFFDPDDKYIWALAVDAQNNLFVGTGPKGVIYKVNPQGQSNVFYDSKETHVVSLSWDLDGNLLAGTAPGALLFRISPNGSPFVLYDSSLQEITAMAVDRYGNIYAAALSRPGGSTAGADASQANTNQGKEAAPQGREGNSQEVTVRISGTAQGSRLEIYKVDKENLVDTLYSSNEELAFDLLVRSNGDLLVATGNKGRIVSINPRRFITFLAQSPEQQVTQLVEVRGQIYAATSNLGRVFQLLSEPASSGVYESKILDARMLSSWGMIRWRVNSPTSSAVKIYARSGNTESADQTWTDWEGPYTDSEGSHITSPAARFLQWKVEFPTDAEAVSLTSQRNALELVAVTYLQRNVPPQVTSVTVHPPGVAFVQAVVANPATGLSPGGPGKGHLRSLPRAMRGIGRNPAAMPPPRRIYTPGARSISWTGSDANGDSLVYSIYYQSRDESSWKLLKEGLTGTFHTIDGVSFPDGVYFLKVVASDAPSNPASQALENEIISRAFVIANSSPLVESEVPQVTGRQVKWQFAVRTRESEIHQAEYSLDGGDWSILFPVDGIADSSSEQYNLTIDDLSPGEHVITVRVADSVGNIGTGKTTVSVR